MTLKEHAQEEIRTFNFMYKQAAELFQAYKKIKKLENEIRSLKSRKKKTSLQKLAANLVLDHYKNRKK